MPGYARPPQYYAQGVQFNPSGNIAATDVQFAIQEVDSEKASVASVNALDSSKIGISVVDAKGDLIVGTANDAISRVAVGSNGQVLVADSSQTAGVRWGTAGATGGGSNQVFYENDTSMTVNYTITSGKNAVTAGPVIIADGATLTIPDGSTWTVV